MQAFESLAEQRIQEALARGELGDLPGEGQPLDLDDDRLVPEELRMVYRVLKNSGVLETVQQGANRKVGESNIFLNRPSNPNISTRDALKRAQQLLGWHCYAAAGEDSTRLWTIDYEDIPVGLHLR